MSDVVTPAMQRISQRLLISIQREVPKLVERGYSLEQCRQAVDSVASKTGDNVVDAIEVVDHVYDLVLNSIEDNRVDAVSNLVRIGMKRNLSSGDVRVVRQGIYVNNELTNAEIADAVINALKQVDAGNVGVKTKLVLQVMTSGDVFVLRSDTEPEGETSFVEARAMLARACGSREDGKVWVVKYGANHEGYSVVTVCAERERATEVALSMPTDPDGPPWSAAEGIEGYWTSDDQYVAVEGVTLDTTIAESSKQALAAALVDAKAVFGE